MFNPLAFARELNSTTPRKNNINPYLKQLEEIVQRWETSYIT